MPRLLLAFPTLLLLAVQSTAACVQDVGETGEPPTRETVQTSGDERIDWADVGETEQKIIDQMLSSDDWAFRALALMRLERYRGAEVGDRILRSLKKDDSWQVRTFAIRAAWLHDVALDPSHFETEQDPRVLRTAVQHGAPVPTEMIDVAARKLLNTKTVDALLLGIELAAASTDPKLRAEGARRTITLIRNMDARVAAVISRRLAAALRINPQPQDLTEWARWLSFQREDFALPAPRPPLDESADSIIARADAESFTRLRDYLGVLRRRDLDMVIAVDATNSMTPVIDEVKADLDSLMLFLSDISSSMRLGLLAYRDHDNPGRLVEAHPLSQNLESLRNFLFGLKTPGGATYPESVLSGLQGCTQFEWREEAAREVMLVGDAPPHDEEASDLRRLLEEFHQRGFTVHAVHVPMQWPAGFLRALPPARAAQEEQWRHDYNLSTQEVFQQIANFGGGKLVALESPQQSDLVRSIMKLTVQPEWWPAFDEFYDNYLALCR